MGVLLGEFVSPALQRALVATCLGALAMSGAQPSKSSSRGRTVTFYRDVIPVLTKRCLSCHSTGGIGGSSLAAYDDVKPKAAAILDAVKSKRMPPWFADDSVGEFANNPRPTDDEIRTLEDWVSGGTPAGKPSNRQKYHPPTAPAMAADLVLTASQPVMIPANKADDYQFLVLSLPFTYERWIRAAEIRPSNHAVLHHAIAYIRAPGSQWLRNLTPGVPYTPPDATALARARSTNDEILAVYAPGADGMICPDGMAKRAAAGSDLVLQLHYVRTPDGATDQPEIGLAMMEEVPKKRVVTLPLRRNRPAIGSLPAGLKPMVTGALAVDALLVSIFPRMYRPGVASDFDLMLGATAEPVLKVKPNNLGLQLNYILKHPRAVHRGTVLRWTPRQEDAAAAKATLWDEQGREEIMSGYFDIAVDPNVPSGNVIAEQWSEPVTPAAQVTP